MRNVCHCGHDKATHYPDEPVKDGYGHKYTIYGNCLGLHCDCKRYVHEDDPLPYTPGKQIVFKTDTASTPPMVKPHSDVNCACPQCMKWLFANRWP